MQKQHWSEVWVMWRNKHNFRLNTFLTIGVWLDIFGIIALAVAAIYDVTNRSLFVSLASLLFILLIISFFATAGDVWYRDTTKLAVIKDEKNNITEFLSSRYLYLYLRNNRQVEVGIEWFNGTIFELEFQLTTGIVKINGLESTVSSIEKRSCSHGKWCNYMVTLTDNDILKIIRKSITNTEPVELFVVLHSEVKVTYEYDGKPESTRQFNAQCSIENTLVIPQKV